MADGCHCRSISASSACCNLKAAFIKPDKLKDLRTDCERFSTTELLFLPSELAEDADATLMKIENVERQAIAFWQPTLNLLR